MTEQPDLVTMLEAQRREAVKLRFEVTPLPITATVPQVLASLLDVRQRLDRVEELLGQAVRVRAAVHRQRALDQAAADDDWDTAVTAARAAPVTRGDEYSSARERAAAANLSTMSARRTARRSVELAQRCDEAVDLIRLSHRGLGDIRQDHLAILRALQFETTLDR